MKTFVTVTAVLFVAIPSFADMDSMRARVPQIVELKDKGLIGEKADGFLGVVKNEGGAQGVVDAENADRREEYGKRAAGQGQTVDVLSKVLGEARVRQEKEGRMINDGGGWKKK